MGGGGGGMWRISFGMNLIVIVFLYTAKLGGVLESQCPCVHLFVCVSMCPGFAETCIYIMQTEELCMQRMQVQTFYRCSTLLFFYIFLK